MASLSDAPVRQLLDGRHIASLATRNPDGSIHVVAVWYLFDGARVYVATSARSRKVRNLQSNSHVSIMIDSRDASASRGINLAGTAQILTGDPSQQWNARIHRKYLSEAALGDRTRGWAQCLQRWTISPSTSPRHRSSIGTCSRQTGNSSVARSRTTLPTCCRWSPEWHRVNHPASGHCKPSWCRSRWPSRMFCVEAGLR